MMSGAGTGAIAEGTGGGAGGGAGAMATARCAAAEPAARRAAGVAACGPDPEGLQGAGAPEHGGRGPGAEPCRGLLGWRSGPGRRPPREARGRPSLGTSRRPPRPADPSPRRRAGMARDRRSRKGGPGRRAEPPGLGRSPSCRVGRPTRGRAGAGGFLAGGESRAGSTGPPVAVAPGGAAVSGAPPGRGGPLRRPEVCARRRTPGSRRARRGGRWSQRVRRGVPRRARGSAAFPDRGRPWLMQPGRRRQAARRRRRRCRHVGEIGRAHV